MPEDPNGDSSRAPHSPHPLHTILASSCPITLKFVDLCYGVKLEKRRGCGVNVMRALAGGPRRSAAAIDDCSDEVTVLNGITGMASPGEILAVLGPSGSGKSTLLNVLAGRLHGQSLTGSVLANGQVLGKPVLKRTGFVAQDDVLYPHLTVRETLAFCSFLRLPKALSKREKVSVADWVMGELGLVKCENTAIGNGVVRGVSGGERKRVSIAHEMLINPSLLILDEPTSGLDSTAAYRLVSTLGSVAQKGKTVIMSVHQPSSRVYQMFDSVLVLSEGRCLYFGKSSEAMTYFESVGFAPSFPMNPADFQLDLANGVYPLEGVSERQKQDTKQSLVSSYNILLAPKVKAACMDTGDVEPKETVKFGKHGFADYCKRADRSTGNVSFWFNEFTVILRRNLKEKRHEAFNSLKVFQVIAASILAGLLWWKTDFGDIGDRLGLLFFISIFWGVLLSSRAVFAFPQDRAIFMKERASGMYTLSSYFMARIIGDLPMELILPTVFLTIVYWTTGLKPQLDAFLSTLVALLGYVLVSQGLGLALGAAIMDAKQASIVVTITMLAFVLMGGFYVHRLPSWIGWIKYVSATFYFYRLLINVQYGEGKAISSVLGCTYYGSHSAGCKFIEEDIEGQIHPAVSVGVLLIMLVGYRLLAYVALKHVKA